MKTALLKGKLNEANRLLAIAEQELQEAMQALSSNGERTMIAATLKDALDKFREARRDVAELERLLEEASPQ
jgi:hypothetical protein